VLVSKLSVAYRALSELATTLVQNIVTNLVRGGKAPDLRFEMPSCHDDSFFRTVDYSSDLDARSRSVDRWRWNLVGFLETQTENVNSYRPRADWEDRIRGDWFGSFRLDLPPIPDYQPSRLVPDKLLPINIYVAGLLSSVLSAHKR
jgi:hypothetical protein